MTQQSFKKWLTLDGIVEEQEFSFFELLDEAVKFKSSFPDSPAYSRTNSFNKGNIQANHSQSGHNISSLDYNSRVAIGKGVEARIIEELKDKYKINIVSPNAQQDMYDKIDGFWDGKPVQIKYRSSGDDILFELIKPYIPSLPMNEQNPGKDLKSKAEIYLVLNRAGTMLYKVPVAHIKVLLKQALKENGDEPIFNFNASSGVVLKAVKDPQSGTPKINAFIPISVFGSIAEKFPVQIDI